MITIFCDGHYRPQDLTGSYGFVIYKNGRKIQSGFGPVESGLETSNNFAEYMALSSALGWLLENNLEKEEIVVKSDSKMLINQMAGKWKVRRGAYLPKHKEAKELSSKFYKINYVWVPREHNKAADKLSREYYHRLF